MLRANHRLRRASEFTAAVRRGRRAGTRSLVVHALLPGAEETSDTHVGFIVSRTVGTAVVRNRVKRRLRGLMAARLGELPSGTLLVVRALPAAGVSSFVTLRADLDRALRRAVTGRGEAARRQGGEAR